MTKIRLVGPTERMIYLRSIPVAAVVPPQVLSVLANEFRETTFAPGEMVVEQGEPIDALELLIEGSLTLTKSGQEVGKLRPPQSIGFLDILARAESAYSAVADSATYTIRLEAETLFEVFEDHFPLLEATLGYLAERLFPEISELPAEALESFLLESFEPMASPGGERSSAPIAGAADASAVLGAAIDPVERMLLLRSTRAFGTTNLNALSALSRQLDEHRLEAGARIWRRGDNAERFAILLSGHARCTAKDGKLFRAGPGTMLGAVESIAHHPRWFDMEAQEPLLFLDGRVDTLLELFEDNFRMASDFVALLATDLRRAIARKLALGIKTLDVRRKVSNLGAVPVGA